MTGDSTLTGYPALTPVNTRRCHTRTPRSAKGWTFNGFVFSPNAPIEANAGIAADLVDARAVVQTRRSLAS